MRSVVTPTALLNESEMTEWENLPASIPTTPTEDANTPVANISDEGPRDDPTCRPAHLVHTEETSDKSL